MRVARLIPETSRRGAPAEHKPHLTARQRAEGLLNFGTGDGEEPDVETFDF